MNLILTTGCNKGCPYCFASKVRNEYGVNMMDFKTFNLLLDKIEKMENPRVKLLGGEPTIHPQFIDFLDEIIKRKLPTTLISNFLFSEKVRNKIIEVTKNVPIDFLVNATNLDENNLIEKWATNYNYIYDFLYKFDIEEKMGIGYTFENDKDWKYYVRYTDFLLQYIPKIERIRLSLNFPDKDKGNFYFINNKEIGEKFLIMTKKAMDIGATPSIDCTVYPCMFQNKEEFKYVRKFVENFKTKCISSPFDVFPDQKAIYCYPLEKSINIDVKEYENADEAKNKLKDLYKKIEDNIEPPEECKNCSFFRKECNGPCLGFYDLGEINGKINNSN